MYGFRRSDDAEEYICLSRSGHDVKTTDIIDSICDIKSQRAIDGCAWIRNIMSDVCALFGCHYLVKFINQG